MALKLNGTNSVAAPAYAGADADTGLQCGSDELKLVTGGSARATVDSSGNVGIGTASSSALLHIAKSGGNAKLLIQRSNTAADTNDYGSILWQSSAGNNNALIAAARQSAENDAYMFFSTASSGSLTERMRITGDGNVSIGTTGPFGGNVTNRRHFTLNGTSDVMFQWGVNGTDRGYLYADATNLSIINTQNGYLRLNTNNTERVRIDNNGYVTIKKNPSNNTCRLSFNHVNSTRIEYSDQSGDLTFYTNSAARCLVGYGGGFRPYTDNSQDLGHSSQRWKRVYAANGTIQTSDEREKTSIATSTLGTEFIKQLRPVSYKWNVGENIVTKAEDGETDVITPRPGERTHWGFIAQEVKQAADTAGVDFGGWILGDKDDPDSTQGLCYTQFIAPLTKALQEAITEIETLKTKVAALEAAS